MRPTRLLRTETFRLALASALLFALSALVLFGVIYWSMTGYATRQFEAGIESDAKSLADAGLRDGIDVLADDLNRRTQIKNSSTYYLLRGPDGPVLAGTIRSESTKPGWHNIRGRNSDGEVDEQHIRAFGLRLTNGAFLLVGRDTHALDEIHELIVRAFGWAGALTAVLAIGAGLLMSLGFLRRLEVINRVTHDIIEGDLNRRVPTRGTDDEMDRLAGNFNRMLERIQALMEGLRQVSNDVAHDLRTPLARIRQRLEDVRLNAGAQGDYESAVDQTLADVDAILGTFNALLRIAQIEAGTRRAGFTDVDLTAIFQNVVEAYAPVAEHDDQALVTDIASGVTVRGDRPLLIQMLANLVENALRHTPSGTRIDVRLKTSAESVVAIVSDTGPGIPEEAHDKVLQRFYRLDASRTTAGSGLGLSLVAAVVELHGASMTLADNAPGLRVILRFKGRGYA